MTLYQELVEANDPLVDRFLDKFVVDGTGCWLWTAAKTRWGHGVFSNKGLPCSRAAHRASYMLFVGPIPDGLVIDHVAARGCISKACVNPAHLEAVTQGENLRRGTAATVAASAKQSRTHCKNDHEFTVENTYHRPTRGTRECLTCRRETSLRHYHEKKK